MLFSVENVGVLFGVENAASMCSKGAHLSGGKEHKVLAFGS